MKKNIFYSFLAAVCVLLGLMFCQSTTAYAGTDAWKTYNDNDSNITYTGEVYARSESGNYGGTYHGFYKGALGSTAKFNFTGNKLLISGLTCSSYTSKVQIQIDGVNYYFCPRTGSSYYQNTLFSKTDLSETEHSVVITNIEASPNPDTYDFRIDAVKIDSDDMLLPYSEYNSSAVIKFDTEDVPVVNDELSLDMYMDNVQDIKGGSIVINYDNSKLQCTGAEAADGMRIVKFQKGAGSIKINVTAKTKNDYVSSKKLLAKLKFKAISKGTAIVRVTGGTISDGVKMSRSLNANECSSKVVVIR